MLQLHPEATIPTRPSSNGPSNPASEEPPRRGGTPPPLGGTRSEAGCRCPKAGKARPSRALTSPRPLDPVASPRAPSGPRLPGSRLSCQSDADFPHGQQTNQRAGVLFDPSARRLFGPSARRSSAFRRALKRGSRWFSSCFFFFSGTSGCCVTPQTHEFRKLGDRRFGLEKPSFPEMFQKQLLGAGRFADS